MTMEISKTEKALRLIATEGISAKEAAERVGISRAAVSKGKLWPSKSTQNIRKLCEMENEIESLRSELAALKAENEWRPISTAPKDEFVLLAGPSGYTTIETVFTTGRMCSDYHAGRWIDHANDDLTDWGFNPTHWMPLPKPPAIDAAMAQGEQ